MAKVHVRNDMLEVRVNMFERLLLAEHSRRIPLAQICGVDAHPPLVQLVLHWADQSSVWMSGARTYEGHLVPSVRNPGQTLAIDVDDEEGRIFVEVDDETCEAVALRIEQALAENAERVGRVANSNRPSAASKSPAPSAFDSVTPLGFDSVTPVGGSTYPQPDTARVRDATGCTSSFPSDAPGALRPSDAPPRLSELMLALSAEQDIDIDIEVEGVEGYFADAEDDDVRRRDPLLQGSFPPPAHDAELANAATVTSQLDVEGLARAGFWLLGGGTVAVLTGTASVGSGLAIGLLVLGAGITACVIGGLAIRLGASRAG